MMSELKEQGSSGWLGRWWPGGGKKEADGPKAVKAHLGDSSSSFYYDKELKKWVNKKVSAARYPRI